MVSIAARMPIVEENPAIVTGTLLFVALGVKLGIFPFHFWLPAVYTGVHASVAAMLSGALAIIGAYGMLRIGAGMLPRELELSAPVLIALGVASILYGGLLSISRHDPAAVVAYSAIGQVGYILIAVAIGGAVGYGAAILFTIWNSMNKTLLFLSGGQLNRYAGIAYAIGGLSVAGIPPVGGFWGKTAVLRATLIADGQIARAFLAAMVVIGGGLSLLYMFQSYGRTYWTRCGGAGRGQRPGAHRDRGAVGGLDCRARCLAGAAAGSQRPGRTDSRGAHAMMRFVFTTAALTAVYALALASADPWDLGFGAALSVCVLLHFGASSCGSGVATSRRAATSGPFPGRWPGDRGAISSVARCK